MIQLETNFLIAAIRPGTSQAVWHDAMLLSGETFAVSAMAWAEFMCGPTTPADVLAAVSVAGPPEPLTAADAERGAELFNLAGRRRGSLADCLVAATALRAGAAVATANRADFAPFAAVGLRVVP